MNEEENKLRDKLVTSSGELDSEVHQVETEVAELENKVTELEVELMKRNSNLGMQLKELKDNQVELELELKELSEEKVELEKRNSYLELLARNGNDENIHQVHNCKMLLGCSHLNYEWKIRNIEY